MADNVNMRDYAGNSKTMRTTDKGTAHVPHHIVDAVSLSPVVSVAMENGHVLSAVAASLAEFDIFCDLDGYIAILDLAAVPANGAMTPLKFWNVSAGTWFNYSPRIPIKCNTGIVIVFSTNASPFVLALSAHMYVSATVVASTGETS